MEESGGGNGLETSATVAQTDCDIPASWIYGGEEVRGGELMHDRGGERDLSQSCSGISGGSGLFTRYI